MKKQEQDFQSTTDPIQSKLPDYPNVSYILHRFSGGRRSRLRRDLLEASDRVRTLVAEVQENMADLQPLMQPPVNEEGLTLVIPLADDTPAPARPDNSHMAKAQQDILNRAIGISERIDRIQETETNPLYLRYGLHSVSGLKINGKPITWESLYEDGPEDLYEEVLEEIKKLVGVTEQDKDDLKSPSTSGATVVGDKINSVAPGASETDSTAQETVQSSSQS